jgi:hypothetical protein
VAHSVGVVERSGRSSERRKTRGRERKI